MHAEVPRTAGPSPRRGWAGSIPEPRWPAVREGESPPGYRRPAYEKTRHMSERRRRLDGKSRSIRPPDRSSGTCVRSHGGSSREHVPVRITFLGHAGLFVETRHGSVLCDPWFTPAYFGSWFPFPRNDRLDPERFAPARLPLRVAPAPRPLRPRVPRPPRRQGRPGAAPGLPDAVPPPGARGPRASATSSRTRDGEPGRSRRPRGRDLRDDGARRRAPRRLRRWCSATARRGCSTRTTPAPATRARCRRSARTTRTSCSSRARSGTRSSTTSPPRSATVSRPTSA